MNTTLRTGQILDSGFEILELVDLPELEAAGIWARHRKSGAEVFHILNDDPENLFAFGFATIPEDSTGVAHILEHSVLCGSENYPLKDAFLVLAQGSLQTYLNAWTFPDKTLYPASSVNEHDYFNLMAVYGDAVFRPLLSEWTFMQEGHRLLFAPGGGTLPRNSGSRPEGLQITGVVYNEMKGAYSSPDAYAELWSVKAVLPDTPYALESGGDPESIPNLTWEGLKEFHRTRYAPANCRIFLAGNIPTEKQLAFLDERFLSRLPPGKAAPPLTRAAPWDSPRTIRVPCPAGEEQKATVFLSWLCGDAADPAETTALSVLTEILLGHDGSPLTRALIESGLGENLAPVTGLENELREILFVAGLRGIKSRETLGGQEPGAAVEALILGELRRLVREGIPQEDIEAALLSLEFSNREIRRSGGPFSLVWLRRSLRGWLHGKKPWERLLFVPVFTALKEQMSREERFFESLIQKYLLDNPHRALVILEPELGYLEKKETALTEALAEREAALSEEERRTITEKNAELEKFQAQGEAEEILARIPHLSRQDLSGEIETIPRELQDVRGIPALTHGVFTNGIIYGDLAFPLDTLTPADYPWLPFFSNAVVSVGLPGRDYGEVSSLLARTAGGLYAMLHTGSSLADTRSLALPGGVLDLSGRDWLVYRLKALEGKFLPALDLTRELIREADFSDLRRLRDLVLEMKSDIDASLAPSGHSYASCRSGRRFSRSTAINELWDGLNQIQFVHTLAEMDTAEISRALTSLRDRIAAGGLLLNLSGSGESLPGALRGATERLYSFGPPRPRNPAAGDAESFFALIDGKNPPEGNRAGAAKAEVFVSPSLQVGFASLALPAVPFLSPAVAAEAALSHWLSTGPLWENIRMRGGAYGVFAHPNNQERVFSFATYRDPSPRRSLEAFGQILGEAAAQRVDEESLVKTIIGTYSRETRPRTGAEKGFIDFFRFLSGIEDFHRERNLRRLIALTAEDIAGAAENLAAHTAEAPVVIISGATAGEKAAHALGVEPQKLPV
ncbi:MAG: insulinase family protein [Spirochaetaceae bacterium]|jgi:Zn-dependent M16 (insulinase) family peptidase|nr:insulinase family protein [Spirochaetaceae bacterium]